MKIEVPTVRREGNGKFITIEGCTGHNLKNVTLKLPLGKFVCVTGVSGSGKSSLINETLYPILANHFYRSKLLTLPYKKFQDLNTSIKSSILTNHRLAERRDRILLLTPAYSRSFAISSLPFPNRKLEATKPDDLVSMSKADGAKCAKATA
jgi:excinuclease UvrABC ATPase subunit